MLANVFWPEVLLKSHKQWREILGVLGVDVRLPSQVNSVFFRVLLIKKNMVDSGQAKNIFFALKEIPSTNQQSCKVTAEPNTVAAFGSRKFEVSLFSLLHEKWDKLSESASPGKWNIEKCGLLSNWGILIAKSNSIHIFKQLITKTN